MHGLSGHDLRVDMNGAERGAAAPRFGGIVEAEDPHVLRDGFAERVERADRVARHKVVGADEEIRQLVECVELLKNLVGMVVPNTVFLFRGPAGELHREEIGEIALVEGLAVVGVADKADAPLPALQRVADKARDLGGVVHIQLIGGEGIAVASGRPVDKQYGKVQAAEHLIIGAVKHLDADDGLDLRGAEGDRQRAVAQVRLGDTVGVERVAQP